MLLDVIRSRYRALGFVAHYNAAAKTLQVIGEDFTRTGAPRINEDNDRTVEVHTLGLRHEFLRFLAPDHVSDWSVLAIEESGHLLQHLGIPAWITAQIDDDGLRILDLPHRL